MAGRDPAEAARGPGGTARRQHVGRGQTQRDADQHHHEHDRGARPCQRAGPHQGGRTSRAPRGRAARRRTPCAGPVGPARAPRDALASPARVGRGSLRRRGTAPSGAARRRGGRRCRAGRAARWRLARRSSPGPAGTRAWRSSRRMTGRQEAADDQPGDEQRRREHGEHEPRRRCRCRTWQPRIAAAVAHAAVTMVIDPHHAEHRPRRPRPRPSPGGSLTKLLHGLAGLERAQPGDRSKAAAPRRPTRP